MKTYTRLLMFVCLLLTAGCGEPMPKKFTVAGIVKFSGQPVSEGTVTLEDNSTGVADAYDIQADGSYAAKVPEGTYRVSVQPPMVTVADSANSEGGDEFKKVKNIPTRYWSSYESRLEIQVTQDTTFDVEMVR